MLKRIVKSKCCFLIPIPMALISYSGANHSCSVDIGDEEPEAFLGQVEAPIIREKLAIVFMTPKEGLLTEANGIG